MKHLFPSTAPIPFEFDKAKATNESVSADLRAGVAMREERLQRELRESAQLKRNLRALESRLSGQRIPFPLKDPILRSSGDIPRLSPPPEAVVIEFRLELGIEAEGYSRYRVAVSGVDGGPSAGLGGLRPRRESDRVFVDVPLVAELFGPGDYRVQLFGSAGGVEDELDQYVFRVERQGLSE